MDKADCIVVGAGVIGLAVARALALAGREVILLEAQSCIGSETSSRNSEVIHAGLYYPQNSLKARFCVKGREQLYEYCRQYRIPHRQCGKLIIATGQQQMARLYEIRDQAMRNGVESVSIIDGSEVTRREPLIKCDRALWSPLTGIIDSHAYMLALLGDIENAGGTLVFNTRVDRGWISRGYPVIEAHNEGEVLSLSANHIFNCAGLEGDRLAREFSGINSRVLPRYSYAKGNYFTYMDASPFSSLIYPIPDQHGLGIHVTLDMAGRIRFGPDVEWIDQINYEIDAGRRTDFARAIRQYWPDCDEERLVPAYSGIRPKINGRGASSADFLVQSESDHGVPGLINLFGIESPGLTSSLALADYVRDLCAQRPNS